MPLPMPTCLATSSMVILPYPYLARRAVDGIENEVPDVFSLGYFSHIMTYDHYSILVILLCQDPSNKAPATGRIGPVGRLFPAGPELRRGARIELRPSTRGPPAGTARRNPLSRLRAA